MGKFAPGKLFNLLSRSSDPGDHSKKSGNQQTTMPVASLADMLAPIKSTQSRLNRLSQYLPKLKTPETKFHEDHEHTLPSKREESPTRNAFSPPPSRAPPPLPPPVNQENVVEQRERSRRSEEDTVGLGIEGEEGADGEDEMWMRGPPSRMAPKPQSANGNENSDAETHNNQRGSQYSPAASPPLQTYTPPLRTDSVSPGTIDYRRPRAESLLPPPTQSQIQLSNSNHRSVSTPHNSRPNSSVYYSDDGGMEALKQIHRRSSTFLTGLFHTPNPSQDGLTQGMRAWVIGNGTENFPEYNLGFLMKAEKIPELWDLSEVADLYIYFFPRASGRGPQIKCPSLIIQHSPILRDLAQGAKGGRGRARSFDGRGSLTIEDATRNLAVRNVSNSSFTPQTIQEPQSADGSEESIRSFTSSGGPRELHLYLPLGLIDAPEQPKENETANDKWAREEREQILIDARNLFAFLTGQAIVATKTAPTMTRCFLAIAKLLKLFGFTEHGGLSFGRDVEVSFDFYLTSGRFADVREGREKTLEALILGERMKSQTLYNEAFAHAVGKYEAMKTLRSPLWDELSKQTTEGVERGYLQIKGYKTYVEVHLTEFDFPSLFGGVANSTSSDESKIVRFKYWKTNFMAMRKVVLTYYKSEYGSWPPKASSKKNSLVEGGLNRLVLKSLYKDLCDLYDYLVDRESITTRVNADESSDSSFVESPPTTLSALRKVLAEFDKSTTWTTPAIPLDVPHLPSLAAIDPHFVQQDLKEQTKMTQKRKLKDNETILALEYGHNLRDGKHKYRTAFMDMYRAFEAKEGKGKTVRELQEQRIGHWIFLYAVLQVLPLLISDAPGLSYTDGVEYFLSATPPERMPWVTEKAANIERYQTAKGTWSYLPTHQIEFGINSIYSRSHCWQAASTWLGAAEEETLHLEDSLENQLSPLLPPSGFNGELRGRASSAGSMGSPLPRPSSGFLGVDDAERSGSRSRLSQRNSIALGLEQLPRARFGDEFAVAAPSTVVRTPPERDVTFDDILAGIEQEGGKKKKGKK